MGSNQPSDHADGAHVLLDVIRRRGREYRQAQEYYARLLHDTYNWPSTRICEALDIDRDTLRRILAADGIYRGVDCIFGSHVMCLGYREPRGEDEISECECECHSACRT